MSLSEDTKAIVASNLTNAISTLIASGKKEDEALVIVQNLYDSFYGRLFIKNIDASQKMSESFMNQQWKQRIP